MDARTLPRVDFTERKLDNGMRVIIAPDHTAPIAALAIWYGVGSRDEDEGLTGLAHLFEHVMFQGSKNVKKGEHFEVVQKLGGSLNASTWWHRTNYYEWAPSHHLEPLLWLEADRLATLADSITQENLDNQRDVVKNERRQSYDDQPYGAWIEQMQHRMFPTGHPYSHSTIGSMEDLSAATVEDCQNFFRTHYAPNNGVISIVGDVETEEAFAMVERQFGWIAPNANLPKTPDASREAGGLGIRDTIKDKLAPLPRIYFAFPGPSMTDPEFNAAEMAAQVLASGRSTRLYKELVRERKICQDATFFGYGFPGTSLLGGYVTPKPEISIEDAEKAFEGVIESLITSPPSDEELDRVRALTERQISETVFQRCFDRADGLSEHAQIYGDGEALNQRLPELLEVTSDQIADAAKKFMTSDNRVTLVYVPEDK